MKLQPINTGVIFKFVDQINSKGQFEKDAVQGIILQSSFDDSAKEPRWVEVVEVCTDASVSPGDLVLLPALRWTSSFTFEGTKLWKTNESEIVAVIRHGSNKFEAMNDFVIFAREEHQKMSTGVLGIIVVTNKGDDTPSGIVKYVGSNASVELVNQRVYFDDTNFTETFTKGSEKLCFIKEDKVLAYEPQ